MVGIESLDALLLYLFFQYLIQFTAQVIQEQRIDHLVDVLNARVVHAAATTGLRIKSTFKDGTKDSWRYLAPIEVETGILQQGLFQFLRELRYFDFFYK